MARLLSQVKSPAALRDDLIKLWSAYQRFKGVTLLPLQSTYAGDDFTSKTPSIAHEQNKAIDIITGEGGHTTRAYLHEFGAFVAGQRADYSVTFYGAGHQPHVHIESGMALADRPKIQFNLGAGKYTCFCRNAKCTACGGKTIAKNMDLAYDYYDGILKSYPVKFISDKELIKTWLSGKLRAITPAGGIAGVSNVVGGVVAGGIGKISKIFTGGFRNPWLWALISGLLVLAWLIFSPSSSEGD